jgi:hypothetical protein
VPPGKEGKIELAVEHTDGYQGEVAKSAGVTTNDPKFASFNLILRARFKVNSPAGSPPVSTSGKNTPFMVEPTDRWITSVLVGNTTQSKLYVINNDSALFHVKKVESTGTDFITSLQPIQDGRRYEITLSTNPALKPGEYHQKLRIMTDNPAMPEVPVQLDLTVFPRIFAMPKAIIMPPLPVHADLSTINWPNINVRKVQATGLVIKKYTTTLPFLKLALLTKQEGEYYEIRLTVDSSKVKPGAFKGMIRIETNDANVPLIEVPVQGEFINN